MPRERYGPNVQRLNRILRAKGDDPQPLQGRQQADTVMLFYLFREDELAGGVRQARLCACAGRDTPERRVLRPPHLARLHFELRSHAAVLAGFNPDSSWQRFLVALESDIGDVQGGTTQEGIHLGRHGRHAGSDSARLPWRRDPRRCSVLLAATDRPARRPVVPDGDPRDSHPGEPLRAATERHR